MNAFDILGLSMGASADEINARFRLLSVKLHPDKAGPEFEGVFKLVSHARSIALGKIKPDPIQEPEVPQNKPPKASRKKSRPVLLDEFMGAVTTTIDENKESIKAAASEQFGNLAQGILKNILNPKGATK